MAPQDSIRNIISIRSIITTPRTERTRTMHNTNNNHITLNDNIDNITPITLKDSNDITIITLNGDEGVSVRTHMDSITIRKATLHKTPNRIRTIPYPTEHAPPSEIAPMAYPTVSVVDPRMEDCRAHRTSDHPGTTSTIEDEAADGSPPHHLEQAFSLPPTCKVAKTTKQENM
jgi:hypothetical protein